MKTNPNHEELLSRLQTFEYTPEGSEEEAQLEQMSLAGVILTLADVTHEREFEVCRASAVHLLGEAYEPEDISLD